MICCNKISLQFGNDNYNRIARFLQVALFQRMQNTDVEEIVKFSYSRSGTKANWEKTMSVFNNMRPNAVADKRNGRIEFYDVVGHH